MRECRGTVYRELLIEKNAHPPRSAAWGELEHRDRLVALRGWELAKELVEGLTALEVVEQRPDRDSSADEHRDAPEDARIAVYDVP
jgi:hypothetical protein